MKRLFAIFAVLLGAVGLLACVGGIIASWMTRDQLTQSGVALLDNVDQTLDVAEQKTDRIGDALRLIREIVRPTTTAILSLSEKAKRATPEDENQLKTLANELSIRLRNMEKMIEAAQTVVSMANATARTAEKLPFSKQLASRLSTMDDLKDSTISLDRLSAYLAKVHEALAQLRQNKELRREIVAEITSLANEVDVSLTTMQDRVNNLQGELKTARVDAGIVRSHLADWIFTGVILLTVLLAWMALGQGALLWWGLSHAGKTSPDAIPTI